MIDKGHAESFLFDDIETAPKVDQHKITAFQVAPVRKTAFDKSREDAQKKADKEAAETAAALAAFEAEYGVQDDDRDKSAGSKARHVPTKWNDKEPRSAYKQSQKRRREDDQPRSSKPAAASFDDVDSEEEERERRQSKMTSGHQFLAELKQGNQGRRQNNGGQQYKNNRQDRRQDRFVKRAASPAEVRRLDDSASLTPVQAVASVKVIVNEEEDESGDDVDYYRTRTSAVSTDEPLNKIHRTRLGFLLSNLSARRGSIARVSAFAMTHAASVNEISETITQEILSDKSDWKLAVARLWCISDILHNSWIPISNVWKYRAAFESRLPSMIQGLRELGESISSRIRRENFRRLVNSVLDVWSSWICFSSGVIEALHEAFEEEKKDEEETAVPEAKQVKKTGGWKKVAGSDNAAYPSDTAAIDVQSSQAVDGEAIDLDGEDIDLDGQAIDLDGEPLDLDGSSLQQDGQSEPSATNTDSQRSLQSLALEPTASSLASLPRMKMTFGKISLKPRPAPEYVKRDTHAAKNLGAGSIPEKIAPDVDVQASTFNSSQALDEPPGADSQPRYNNDRPSIVVPATANKPIRPQRRSAADFMN